LARLARVPASCNALCAEFWNSEEVGSGILLVDDSRSCADAVRLLLERQGAQVVGVAATSAEAVELVAALRPAVVLLDLMLGEECGLNVARLLARHGSDDAPAIILISACAQLDVAELVAMSPAAGFLSKSDLSADAVRQIVRDAHVPNGDSLAGNSR
jgi:DNA-binding NarL/FixJ family response regulator